MNYQSESVVFGAAFANTVLAAYKVDPGAALIVTPKVRLSKDPGFNPVPGMLLVDLTPNEADFSGYTAGGYTPTLTAPVNLTPNIHGLVSNVLPTANAATVGNVIYGWWLDDGTNVICGERFADGVTFQFAQSGDFLDLAIAIPFDFNQLTQ